MQQAEQSFHVKTTQKMVENFEFFVLQMEKLNEPITDVTLVRSLRKIGRKLQSVFNKWDQKQRKSSLGTSSNMPDSTGTEDLIFGASKYEIPRETGANTVETHEETEDSDDFEMAIEKSAGGGNVDRVSERDTKKMRTETTSAIKNPTEPSLGDSDPKEEIFRKLQEEGIDQTLTEGICIGLVNAKYTWSCVVCNIADVPVVSLKSHVIGKQHKKKLVSQHTSRESSSSRMNVDETNDKASVPDYVQTVQHFFCGKCNVTLTTEEALNSHLASAHIQGAKA